MDIKLARGKKVTLGTVSHATMRPEDLIPAFLAEIEYLATKKSAQRVRGEIRKIRQECRAGDFSEQERDDYILELLFDALGSIAPPLCYFGAHEGDGADYGFWFSPESLDEGIRYGSIIRVDAGDAYPDRLGTADYIAEVTDHGNVTIIDRNGEVVLEVV